MDTSVEQRVCLKFCIANDISCSESLRMLQKAFGDSALSKTRAYEWYKQFKNGRTAIDDLSRAGRPSTANTEENVAKAKEIVLNTFADVNAIAFIFMMMQNDMNATAFKS
ncbi:Protein GVQW3 [Anthophora retusa]